MRVKVGDLKKMMTEASGPEDRVFYDSDDFPDEPVVPGFLPLSSLNTRSVLAVNRLSQYLPQLADRLSTRRDMQVARALRVPRFVVEDLQSILVALDATDF